MTGKILNRIKGLVGQRDTLVDRARMEADVAVGAKLVSFRSSQHWLAFVNYVNEVMLENMTLLQSKILDKETLYIINVRLETLQRLVGDIEAKVQRGIAASKKLAEINERDKLKESKHV